MKVSAGFRSFPVTKRLWPVLVSVLEKHGYTEDELNDEAIRNDSFEVLPGDFEPIQTDFRCESRAFLSSQKNQTNGPRYEQRDLFNQQFNYTVRA